MNSKDYPLTLAKDIETLLRNIRRFQLENSDVVQFVQDAYLVKLKDVSSNFYFIIKNPRMTDKNISSIQYTFLPAFLHNLNPKDSSCNISDIYGILERWIKMIRDYNNIRFSQEDYIQKFYEQEFLEEFEIIDENADIEPFNFEQQEKLNTLLLNLSNAIEDHKEKINDSELILAETKQLIKDLPLATKKKFMKDFSKIIGKLRKFGVEVFKEILKDSVKESLKFLINNIHHIA